MKNHQRSILLLTEWADPRFYHGVATYAKQAGWHLNIDYIYTGALPKRWKGDGCVHFVGSQEARDFIDTLDVPHPCIVGDPVGSGTEAADYLSGLGFCHFAFYTSDANGVISMARHEGYSKRLEALGFTATTMAWSKTGSDDDLEWDERKAWLVGELTKLPKPAAVFCTDDRMALRIVEACMASNIDVPGDVAVLGVGNLELACECSAVPISSIRIDFEKMGYESAAQLDRILDGETGKHIVIHSAGIEERRSTYTLAVEDPAGRRALRFMLDHCHEPIGIDAIAAAGKMTRWQLSYVTGKELNTTPGKLLTDVRFKKACDLLRTTNYPVKRVAYETGLGTALSLQRLFRNRLKTTPTAWRKAQG